MSSWPAVDELTELMELKDVQVLSQHGGIPGILKKLRSSEYGIDSKNPELEERQRIYGKNELVKPEPASFLSLWIDAFKDTTLIILLVLAAVSLIIAIAVEKGKELSWLDGVAIFATVIVVTCLLHPPLVV